jgi:hypothetical protein
LSAAGCAKIMTPSGGPRDSTPPKVSKENPANGTTNFTGNSFKITFDEFVTLNNPTENVLISPPPATNPTYTLSGKTLTVKFQDTLLPNHTYNVSFADCIRDFTEGNPIPLYNYAFSTGNAVDSLIIEGKVVDAKTAEPSKNCYVFAYDADIDSLPLTSRPQYITKTQSNGTFRMQNLKEGKYKIFVIEDVDNNLMYNMESEAVAFCDSMVAAVAPARADTARADSLRPARKTPSMLLRLFTASTDRKLIKSQNRESGKYEFFFSKNIENPQFAFLQNEIEYYFHAGHDTLIIYTKTTLADTVVLRCEGADGVADTLTLTPYKARDVRGGRRGQASQNDNFSVKVANAGELYVPLQFVFPYPVRPADSIPVRILAKRKYAGNDTNYVYICIPDSFEMAASVDYRFEERVPYEILVADSLFVGYNGQYNDTITAHFTAKTEKDYGALRMHYELPDDGTQYVATLMKDGGTELRSDLLTQSGEVFYDHLPAGKYKVKLLEDRNGNGEWDTGDYRRKLQPERVVFFSKPVSIRGFWELEETFTWPEE